MKRVREVIAYKDYFINFLKKTPKKEIKKAEKLMQKYFNEKNENYG